MLRGVPRRPLLSRTRLRTRACTCGQGKRRCKLEGACSLHRSFVCLFVGTLVRSFVHSFVCLGASSFVSSIFHSFPYSLLIWHVFLVHLFVVFLPSFVRSFGPTSSRWFAAVRLSSSCRPPAQQLPRIACHLFASVPAFHHLPCLGPWCAACHSLFCGVHVLHLR